MGNKVIEMVFRFFKCVALGSQVRVWVFFLGSLSALKFTCIPKVKSCQWFVTFYFTLIWSITHSSIYKGLLNFWYNFLQLLWVKSLCGDFLLCINLYLIHKIPLYSCALLTMNLFLSTQYLFVVARVNDPLVSLSSDSRNNYSFSLGKIETYSKSKRISIGSWDR